MTYKNREDLFSEMGQRTAELSTELLRAKACGDRRGAEILDARMREVGFLMRLLKQEEGDYEEVVITDKEDGANALHFLEDAFARVFYTLHHQEFLRPREQWTIPMATACGFVGELRLRTASMGTCALDGVKPEGPTEDIPTPPSAWNDGRPRD